MCPPALRARTAARVRRSPLVLLLAAACAPGPEGSTSAPEPTRFVEDSLARGSVVENSTACSVDAVCYLRIAFADTVVVAVYGTGERPAPPCTISVDVSDAAFEIEAGDVVDVVISRCGEEGYYLERIEGST
jgi:hypothetical protein